MKKKLIILTMISVFAIALLAGCESKSEPVEQPDQGTTDVIVEDNTEQSDNVSVSISEDEDMNGSMGNAGYVDEQETAPTEEEMSEDEDMAGAMGNAGNVDGGEADNEIE